MKYLIVDTNLITHTIVADNYAELVAQLKEEGIKPVHITWIG